MRLRARCSFDDVIYSTMADGMEDLVRHGLDADTATQAAVDALVSASDSTAPTIVSTLKRTTPRMLRQHRRCTRVFRRVMKKYWGRTLDLYFSICVAMEEFGRNFDDSHTEEAMEEQDYLFEALTGLHARACRAAVEIYHLLAGGFPMGALARCRTLHELAVTMMVLSDFGQMEEHADLAERFLFHDDIDNWTDAQIHQEHYEVLGNEAFTADEMAEMKQRREELLRRFGESYRYSYGWAVGLNGLKKPEFRDLERMAKVPHLRGHYRWASHEVHAGSKGWRLNVFERGDLLYKEAGPMHFGLAEPGCMALTSLRQCLAALLFSTNGLSPQDLLALKVIEHLTNDAADTFSAAEQAVEELDEQLRAYPPWARRLWARWLSLGRRR